MGLFNMFNQTKSYNIPKTEFQAPNSYTPTQYQNNYQQYDAAGQNNFNVNNWTGGNPYEGANQSTIGQLTNMAANGGFTDQQKQTMIQGAMAPVRAEADQQARQAQADAYSRGLGQSSVLDRNYRAIGENVANNLAQISGNVEQQSAQAGMQAMQMIQQGKAQEQQARNQLAQLQQQNEVAKMDTMAKLNMDQNQYALAINKLQQTENLSAAERELAISQMANQFNLDQAQMNLLVQQAENERLATEAANKAAFISNMFGGVMGAAGNIFGGIFS
jgi:hypothetical protein